MDKTDFKNNIFSLSERIYPMVSRMLGNEQDAKDAIQEIMIKLWKKQASLVDHPNQSGFVFLTARNYCLDLLKQKKPTILNSEVHLNNETSASGQEDYELKELIALIETILKNGPALHKEVLLMRDLDGMEYDEIAEATNLKIGHIRVLISRTRKQVQEQLKKSYSYD